MIIMTGKCAFRTGHTTLEGKKTAPEKCKRALEVLLREKVEVCPITKAEDCPMKAFTPEPIRCEVKT